jgi:translation initiation factor 2B subunit (eIF-2B alpha/beta/delta family)
MTAFYKKLEQIISNKKLGSSELVNKLNELCRTFQSDHKLIKSSIPLISSQIGHFSTVSNYISELNKIVSSNDKVRIKKFFDDFSKNESAKYQSIFNKLLKYIPDSKKVITLSRSGTVLNILKIWQRMNKNIRVVVCESRPMLEGRLLAEDLLKFGLKVELVADSVMSLFVPKVDAAIIGADSVFKNGNVINKTGSKSLALLCKKYKIPFYVIATRSKFCNKKSFKVKIENPDEIWTKKHKNLIISNIYFEEIENRLITKIFTE